MGHYTIKELEHLSGIKAHTIRVWEQRYNLLCPKRTDTNIRYYNDRDLKTLLNVSVLNEQGLKISKIAKMNLDQISDKVQQLSEGVGLPSHSSSRISALVNSMLDMAEDQFDKIISTAMLQLGVQETMLQIVYPFLNKIGILWQTNNISPAHEHFVSNLIRQKLIVAIDGQVMRRQDGAPIYILYLPEGELHELALLFMNYIARSHHKNVVYLGQNLPFKDLELTYEHFKPNYICTVLTSTPERDKVQAYIDKLSNRFPDCTVFVYGMLACQEHIVFPANVKLLRTMHDYIAQF